MTTEKRYKLILFSFATFFTSFGNALAIYTDVGTAPWSAANLNISNTLNSLQNFITVTPGNAFNFILFIFFICNKLMEKEPFSFKKDSLVLIYVIVVGRLIDFFLFIFPIISLPDYIYLLNVFYSIFGTLLIGLALLLFIRANITYLPVDDFIKNITFYFFKGNIRNSTFVFFAFGLLLAIVSGLIGGSVVAINYITIILLIIFSPITNFLDNHLTFIDAKLESFKNNNEI